MTIYSIGIVLMFFLLWLGLVLNKSTKRDLDRIEGVVKSGNKGVGLDDIIKHAKEGEKFTIDIPEPKEYDNSALLKEVKDRVGDQKRQKEIQSIIEKGDTQEQVNLQEILRTDNAQLFLFSQPLPSNNKRWVITEIGIFLIEEV